MIIAFTGLKQSGKTFLVNNLAEVLSSKGEKVAIIDISKSRDLYHFYFSNIDKNSNGALTLQEQDSISYANIDIYTSKEFDITQEYFKRLPKNILQMKEKYKVILLDIDLDYIENIRLEHYCNFVNLVLTQCYLNNEDKEKMLKMIGLEKINIILNKFLETRFNVDRVFNQFQLPEVFKQKIVNNVRVIDYEQVNEEIYQNNFFKNKGTKKYTEDLKDILDEFILELGIDSAPIKNKRNIFPWKFFKRGGIDSNGHAVYKEG